MGNAEARRIYMGRKDRRKDTRSLIVDGMRKGKSEKKIQKKIQKKDTKKKKVQSEASPFFAKNVFLEHRMSASAVAEIETHSDDEHVNVSSPTTEYES